MCPDGNAEFLQKRAIASPFRHTHKIVTENRCRHSDQTALEQGLISVSIDPKIIHAKIEDLSDLAGAQADLSSLCVCVFHIA